MGQSTSWRSTNGQCLTNGEDGEWLLAVRLSKSSTRNLLPLCRTATQRHMAALTQPQGLCDYVPHIQNAAKDCRPGLWFLMDAIATQRAYIQYRIVLVLGLQTLVPQGLIQSIGNTASDCAPVVTALLQSTPPSITNTDGLSSANAC